MKSIIITFLLAFAVSLSVLSCGDAKNHTTAADSADKQVVIDTDMGLDDMRAIMAALADTSMHVRGIVVNTGSALAGAGADNLIGMLESHHVEHVPVLKGTEAFTAAIPDWRGTANSLAGKKFAPPRELTAAALPEGWYDSLPLTDILALGPLSDLARQMESSRLLRSKNCRIWIPASVTGPEFHEWNLACDPDAAATVFSQAGTVCLVDIPGRSPAEDYAVLAGVQSSAPGARWIRDVIASVDTLPAHLQLFDEFVVAALLDPGLVSPDEQRFRAAVNPDGTGALIPDAAGNVRLFTFRDRARAETLLTRLWQNGPVSDHDGLHGPQIQPEKYLSAFHGHLGPYVVLGYRMGQLALDTLDSDGHFDLETEVHSILTPPFSCFIDGIQLGTGCTLGKRNISIHMEPGPAWGVFTSGEGMTVTIRLRPEIPGQVAQLVNTRGVEAAGKEMFSRSAELLFVFD